MGLKTHFVSQKGVLLSLLSVRHAMPTIITTPVPNAPFGPGFTFVVQTNTIGPFNGPITWDIHWTPDTGHDGEEIIGQYDVADPHSPFSTTFPIPAAIPRPTEHATQGTTGTFLARLLVNGDEAERASVAVRAEWLIGAQFQLGQKTGSGGALTEEQALQLQETHDSTFPAISLDALTLQELTSGPQGEFVAAQLGAWIYGVLVRIAEVPPEFRVDTADGDYWVRSLAVVRIYRGSDLWKRVPVHTSSKLISFVEEGLVTAVAAILPVQWLLQISVQVSFAPGVLGQVYLLNNP